MTLGFWLPAVFWWNTAGNQKTKVTPQGYIFNYIFIKQNNTNIYI